MDGFALVKDKNAYDGGIIWRKCGRRDWSRLRGCVSGDLVPRATASKYLLPFAYGNAVKTSSLLC